MIHRTQTPPRKYPACTRTRVRARVCIPRTRSLYFHPRWKLNNSTTFDAVHRLFSRTDRAHSASETHGTIGPLLRRWALIHCRRLFYFFAYLTRPCCATMRESDEIAPGCFARPRAHFSASPRRNARFFMRTCERMRGLCITHKRGTHILHTRGRESTARGVEATCARARLCTRALARISRGAIISHRSSTYIIPATERALSQLSALHAVCLSRPGEITFQWFRCFQWF